MSVIHAGEALLADGWARDVRIRIGADGRIAGIDREVAGADRGIVALPAPGNLHSHAFQRAMAGLSEARSSARNGDSFWTWQKTMYRFLERLGPDDVEAIAAMLMVESAEAGFAALGEFHYLHHAPGGERYDDPAEMAMRIAAAARETGMGLTLLPVLYVHGGADGRPLAGAQLRFGSDADGYLLLLEGARRALDGLDRDAVLGVAPHSLRAVDPAEVVRAASLVPEGPVHIHAAEQEAEVEEIMAAYGCRPVEMLLDLGVDRRWCLIHATHMTEDEAVAFAKSDAVAGLCPVTESNLGDGIFEGPAFLGAGGAFGVGSDSNLRIDLAEELRVLEHSQRLRDRARAVMASPHVSCGRTLWEGAARGAAQALGRGTGGLALGEWADILTLDAEDIAVAGLSGDRLLDAHLFAGPAPVVDLWSAGRHVVTEGHHPARHAVASRYREVVSRLRADI